MLSRRTARLPTVTAPYIDFDGGLYTDIPSIKSRAGWLADSLNYERGTQGGYIDIEGYERLDGQPAPSAAVYYRIPCTYSGHPIAAGDTITGDTSGATAVVLAQIASGLIVTKVDGTFTSSEDLSISATVVATATNTPLLNSGGSNMAHATYTGLAADNYRADITAVPGEGDVLGIWRLAGTWYAVRNATGGASAKIYKSSASGWTEVALGRRLAFTAGTSEISVGDTITGATSGATAVVTSIAVTSGTWGGTAAGVIVFASQTGTFQAENITVGGTPSATIAGNSSAITLAPGGRYQTVNYRFPGTAATLTWGASGTNEAFSFSGTVYQPIPTGMADDTPDHVIAHLDHLVLAFGPSVQISGLGLPYSWTVNTGASEINAGADVTGFLVLPGSQDSGALLIATRERVQVLYGTSSADFQKISYRNEVGAWPYTLQQVGTSVFLDDLGLIDFKAVQEYGNFKHSSMTEHLSKWLNPKTMYACGSMVVRAKNQYRLFFSNKHALYCTFKGNKLAAAMPVYLSHAPTCTWHGEDADGTVHLAFGAANGMVYELDKGTSFDGSAIAGFFKLHPLFEGAPRAVKSYHSFEMESAGTGYAEWELGYQLEYGNSAVKAQPDASESILGDFQTSLNWDSGATWDSQLKWDTQGIAPSSRARISGSGKNIILLLRKNSAIYKPVLHSGGTLRHTIRRLAT